MPRVEPAPDSTAADARREHALDSLRAGDPIAFRHEGERFSGTFVRHAGKFIEVRVARVNEVWTVWRAVVEVAE